MKDILYKRGFSCPFLRCLSPEEVDYVMREVHEGINGNHSVAYYVSTQAYSSKILLAYYAEGCQGICQKL